MSGWSSDLNKLLSEFQFIFYSVSHVHWVSLEVTKSNRFQKREKNVSPNDIHYWNCFLTMFFLHFGLAFHRPLWEFVCEMEFSFHSPSIVNVNQLFCQLKMPNVWVCFFIVAEFNWPRPSTSGQTYRILTFIELTTCSVTLKLCDNLWHIIHHFWWFRSVFLFHTKPFWGNSNQIW